MRKASSLALIGFVPLVTLAAGCGGNQTTASKSAAEFDAAEEKGMSPGAGQAHGGHSQATEPEGSSGATHGRAASDMGRIDHTRMPGMQGGSGARPAQAGAGSSMAGMDHSRMPAMGSAPATRPPATGAPRSSMPDMDHSTMAQPPETTGPPPLPDRPVAVAAPGQPAATLRPDELDKPVPTAIREAARSAEMAMQVAGGGHGMQHGTYRQIDAGREDVTPAPQKGHEGHQPAPPPTSGSADPHGMHAAPSSPDPHAMHGAPTRKPAAKPSPRPTPTPRPKEDNR